MRYCFYPYVLFFFFAQVYYLEFMLINVIEFDENDENQECGLFSPGNLDCRTWSKLEQFFRWGLLILTTHQISLEVFQVRQSGFSNYIREKSNVIDDLALLLNFFCVVMVCLRGSVDISMYTIRILASMCVVSLWV